MKILAPVLLLSALSTAPFQCASDPDPNQRREESPGEALYGLSQQFEKSGDKQARIATLEFLVRRYPSSHFAETAKSDLRELGVTVPEETPEPVKTSTRIPDDAASATPASAASQAASASAAVPSAPASAAPLEP